MHHCTVVLGLAVYAIGHGIPCDTGLLKAVVEDGLVVVSQDPRIGPSGIGYDPTIEVSGSVAVGDELEKGASSATCHVLGGEQEMGLTASPVLLSLFNKWAGEAQILVIYSPGFIGI